MSSNMFAKLVNLLQETNRTIKHFQEKAKEKEELAHQWQKKYEKLLQLHSQKSRTVSGSNGGRVNFCIQDGG